MLDENLVDTEKCVLLSVDHIFFCFQVDYFVSSGCITTTGVMGYIWLGMKENVTKQNERVVIKNHGAL